MTHAEFDIQLARLVETYGATPYKPERVKLIWSIVSKHSPEWFARTCDQLIGSCRQAPLVTEFAEQSLAESERQWATQKHEKISAPWKPNPDCDYCGDMGVYLCTHHAQPGFWAFRCHCRSGENHPNKRIPQFKASHSGEFTWFDPQNAKLPTAQEMPR